MTLLTADALKIQLPQGWSFESNALVKTFDGKSYRAVAEAVASMVEVAEQMNHHPDLQWVYTRITFRLSTHDAGGVTEKDVTLAQAIEKLFNQSKR